MPTCFNKLMLIISFRTKFEHTVQVGEKADNFHSNHHTVHTKNFGVGQSFGLLDLYLSTFSNCQENDDLSQLFIKDKNGRIRVEKLIKEDQDAVDFIFTRE